MKNEYYNNSKKLFSQYLHVYNISSCGISMYTMYRYSRDILIYPEYKVDDMVSTKHMQMRISISFKAMR